MGLFTPHDTSALYGALSRGSLEDVLAVYRKRWVRYEYSGGSTLLSLAVKNKDLEHGRVPIAHRLLDDGVDVGRGHPLHVLLARRDKDLEREPALIKRMLDLGADVNERYEGRGDQPLLELVYVFAVPEGDLLPYYDVIFAREELDLHARGTVDIPLIEALRRAGEHRPEALRRAEAYLARTEGPSAS